MSLTLDAYQDVGADFLAARPCAYLMDTPGVGKTPQAIVAANRTGLRRVHVTAPAIAVPNWRREISAWAARPDDWTVSSFHFSAEELPTADIQIVDEAHFLKEPTSLRTIKLLGTPGNPLQRAKRTWALSGTPMPNAPHELWTWLVTFGRTRLNYDAFLGRFCTFYMTDHGPRVTGMRNRREFADIIRPISLRRTMAEVLPGMPPIRWSEITLQGPKLPEDAEGLLHLKSDLEIDDDEHLATLRRLVGEAKADPLGEYLKAEMNGSDEKLVVFAHHTSVIDILYTHLQGHGCVVLDGRVPQNKRGVRVDEFQTNASVRVALCQIDAAGTAITLTAARLLVFAEMSFNPSTNEQAFLRVYRRGQTRPVLVRVASLANSVDQGVMRTNARKTEVLTQAYSAMEQA